MKGEMIIKSVQEMQDFGAQIGALLVGGEVIELVGDVGAGKTTFVRGLAHGMAITETIQSPSFTINRVYDAPHGLRLVHYDFYRLDDPGIMADELREELDDKRVIVVIEWAEAVGSILPDDRLVLALSATGELERNVTVRSGGQVSQSIVDRIRK